MKDLRWYSAASCHFDIIVIGNENVSKKKRLNSRVYDIPLEISEKKREFEPAIKRYKLVIFTKSSGF